MTVIRFVPRDTRNRTELWIAAGIDRRWRVTSASLSYGEFDEINDARAFLHLLLKGNPERFRGIAE